MIYRDGQKVVELHTGVTGRVHIIGDDEDVIWDNGQSTSLATARFNGIAKDDRPDR